MILAPSFPPKAGKRRGISLAGLALCCFLRVLAPGPALAGEAAPAARDEALEKRFDAIVAELRCLVCQNESLAVSSAGLADDLRREIRGMLQAGHGNDEIMAFLVGRYGDFVRYRPPFKAYTLPLWLGPAFLLAGGLGGLWVLLRRRSRAIDEPPLSEAERREAERLLRPGGPEA